MGSRSAAAGRRHAKASGGVWRVVTPTCALARLAGHRRGPSESCGCAGCWPVARDRLQHTDLGALTTPSFVPDACVSKGQTLKGLERHEPGAHSGSGFERRMEGADQRMEGCTPRAPKLRAAAAWDTGCSQPRRGGSSTTGWRPSRMSRTAPDALGPLLRQGSTRSPQSWTRRRSVSWSAPGCSGTGRVDRKPGLLPPPWDPPVDRPGRDACEGR